MKSFDTLVPQHFVAMVRRRLTVRQSNTVKLRGCSFALRYPRRDGRRQSRALTAAVVHAHQRELQRHFYMDETFIN